MLTISFLMLVSSKKMTNLADSLDPRTTITHSCSRIDVYADAFVGCIRGNAKTLHRMVICSSDCNLRRDLNSLVMFCVSTQLTVDGRGSSLEWYCALNISEMTESAVYDLEIDFQDVLARLVYYMAEAFIVASMSHCHKVNRLSLLSRIGRYEFESDEYGVVLDYAVASAAPADNIFERHAE
jgi:hypothetical protein